MRYESSGTPDSGMIRVHLATVDEVQAEVGTMVGLDDAVEMETSMKGGLLQSAQWSVMGGESFFLNTLRAPAGGGRSSWRRGCRATCSRSTLTNRTAVRGAPSWPPTHR